VLQLSWLRACDTAEILIVDLGGLRVLVFQVVQLFEKSQVGHRGGVLASLIIDVKLVKNSYIELLGASIFILRGHGGLDTSRDE
jgi:hypothetical protein